nr:DNA helicase [Tanacetum cinerariifolium]
SKETDPEGHMVVAEFMIHGPCGAVCPTAACMKNGPTCTDRIAARLTRTDVPNDVDIPSLNEHPRIVTDEIKNYLDSRYIGPHEACWRLFEFDIHYRDPVVQVLAVHAENMQRVVFREKDQLESVANNPHKKKTTLTEWLDYNSHHTDGRQLTYLDFPSKYVWDKSHRDIRTINHIVYPTCRAACEVMGLLGDDKEWESILIEASTTTTPTELRTLLAHIFTHCEVSNPLTLWKRIWNLIIPLPPEDLMLVLTNRLLMEEKSYDRDLMAIQRDKLIHKLNDCQRNIFNLIIHAVAIKIQKLIFVYGHGGTGKTFLWKTIIYALRGEGKIVLAVASFGIASLLLPSGRTAYSRFKLPLDLSDSSVCLVTKNTQLARLLKETDLIIWDESPMNDRRCFETLDRTLRYILDTPNKLFGGKPIMLGGDFRQTLPVKKSASRSSCVTIMRVSLHKPPTILMFLSNIIGLPIFRFNSWGGMPEKFSVFKYLTGYRSSTSPPLCPCGMASSLLMQTLPVKKSASRTEIIGSSIAESYLWHSFKLFLLTENMRLTQGTLTEVEKTEVLTFAQWLLNVGDGVLGVPDESDPENTSWLEIPTLRKTTFLEFNCVNNCDKKSI